MNLYKYFFLLLFFTSCNLSDNLKKVDTINSALTEEFNTDSIDTTVKWGTNSEDNNIVVSFYGYDFGDQTHKDLDSLATIARKIIIEKFPEAAQLNHIEVRFTEEEDLDKAKSFTSFR